MTATALLEQNRSGPEDRAPVIARNGMFPPVGSSPLAKQTEKLSALTQQQLTRSKKTTASRFRLRETLHDVSTNKRAQWCGLRRISVKRQPSIIVNNGVAHFAGVQACGAIWACPVCGPKIRQQRAKEVEHACQWNQKRAGFGSIYLLTLTMPHKGSDRLAPLVEAIGRAFTALTGGRARQELKRDYGLDHYIRAHDVTHGVNGWHPHLHVLVFGDRVLSPEALQAVERKLWLRWSRSIQRSGYAAPTRAHGVRLERARSTGDVSRYISQVCLVNEEGEKGGSVAMEIARTDLKTSRNAGQRTPWQILEAISQEAPCDGDGVVNPVHAREVALWREWEKATEGVQSMRWSNGLKALVGIAEITDAEIAAAKVGGVVVMELRESEWEYLRRNKGSMAHVLALAADDPAGGSLWEYFTYATGRAKPPPLDSGRTPTDTH